MKSLITTLLIGSSIIASNASDKSAAQNTSDTDTVKDANPCAVSTPYETIWKKQLFEQLKNQNVGTWGVNVVMLGDSLTALWRPNNFANGVKVLKKYRDTHKNINPYSFGIPGDEPQNILWQITDGGILKNINCKVISLMIGVNSLNNNKSPEQVAKGITKIVEAIRKTKPNAKILLHGIWPCWGAQSPIRARIITTNKIISKLASDDKVTYIDLGKNFINDDGEMNKKLIRDGLHLTEEGYELWGRSIFPKISEMIAAPNKELSSL